jgi:outer membrane protein OmpA-like peptidoglycan-associated protein
MKTIQFLILGTVVALFASCAAVPPKELTHARLAYQQASEDSTTQLVPAELHKAHEALKLAEQSFLKDPDSYKTRDLAYVAQRKSELARALGATAANKASKTVAETDFQTKQTEIVKQGKQDLSDAEKRAADERGAQAADRASKAEADADLQKKQTEIVKQDLRDSQEETADALAKLAKLAAVKEEERGLVVTLSGSVLFASNQATFLPAAQSRLSQVADVLLTTRERNLTIQGHTDSQGSDSYNLDLSQRRADAVRNYLVQRGYPADRIQAHGLGKGQPIADNASAEGRANNRRVEIIIQRQ